MSNDGTDEQIIAALRGIDAAQFDAPRTQRTLSSRKVARECRRQNTSATNYIDAKSVDQRLVPLRVRRDFGPSSKQRSSLRLYDVTRVFVDKQTHYETVASANLWQKSRRSSHRRMCPSKRTQINTTSARSNHNDDTVCCRTICRARVRRRADERLPRRCARQ